MMMTGIEPMGLAPIGARSNAINAVMKKSCLSNSDQPPQSLHQIEAASVGGLFHFRPLEPRSMSAFGGKSGRRDWRV